MQDSIAAAFLHQVRVRVAIEVLQFWEVKLA